MIETLKFIVGSQLKHGKLTRSSRGFTLIELLVGLVLAFLVIVPLLGFMIDILNNDRQEQAKATSEQELQAAIDYIARDLEQAVYIYDGNELQKNTSSGGIKNQIPPTAAAPGCGDNSSISCEPILVFWKRVYQSQAVPLASSDCTPAPAKNNTCKDDSFIYALVGYYITTGKDPNSNWSQVARIGRFEIRDAPRDPNGARNPDGTLPYIQGQQPSQGFKPFDLSLSSSLKVVMDQWQKDSKAYQEQTMVLVDYIDRTILSDTSKKPLFTNFCNGVLSIDPTAPTDTTSGAILSISTNKLAGFYACIDSSKSVAQIYLKGNALARLGDSTSTSPSTYFPMTTLRVQGRGSLAQQGQ